MQRQVVAGSRLISTHQSIGLRQSGSSMSTVMNAGLALRMFGFRPIQKQFANWSIYKGDLVEVNTGADRGKQGTVIKVLRKRNQLLVQGVNLKYRTVKDDENVEVKKTVQKESLIHLSNVNLVDPKLKVGTKIGWGFLESGEKVRVSKKTGEVITKPDRSHLTYENRTKDFKVGSLDTPKELVMEKTYSGEDFFLIEEEFYDYLRMKEDKEQLLVFQDRRGGHWEDSKSKEYIAKVRERGSNESTKKQPILPRFHVELSKEEEDLFTAFKEQRIDEAQIEALEKQKAQKRA